MRTTLLVVLVVLPAFVVPRAAGAVDGLCPAEEDTPTAVRLGRAEFLKVLGDLRREHAKRAGSGISELDKTLAAAENDDAGANSALALSMVGGSSAAVYATAWSCVRKPDNATFAGNLGALLDGLEDQRALAVLSYAVSLTPGGVLPNANLGWYLFNRGQFDRAKGAFAAAARKAPDLGPVLLGQGLVAHCQGDHRSAIQYLSRALSVTSSGPGEQALDESQAEEGQQPPSSPSAVPAPRRDDWTKGGRALRVVIADPVVSGSNQELVMVGLGKNGAIAAGYDSQAKALIARQQGLHPNHGRVRPPVRTATSVTLYRSDDAMAALARAQYTAYQARRRAVRAPFERAFEQQGERVGKTLQRIDREAMAGPPEEYIERYCKNARPALEQEYGRFKVLWAGSWEAERKTILEYGATAGATISQIRHDDLRGYLDIERQLHLISMSLDGPADVIGWGVIGAAIMPCGPSSPGPGPTSTEPSDDAKKAPCPRFLQGGVGVDVLVASVSLDCEKISFQAGEGFIGKFEQNYVKHEQTYFFGVGFDAKAGAGAVGAGVEGSAGVFVTCSGNTVRDVGFGGSSSASVGALKGELSGTIGLFGGPSGAATGSLDIGPVNVGL